MAQPPDYLASLYQTMHDFAATIASAALAMAGKISNELLMKRKFTWSQWCGIVGISLFWAWMAGLFCRWMQYDYIFTSIIVGLVTLMGEKINMYVFDNYKDIFSNIIAIFTKKRNEQ